MPAMAMGATVIDRDWAWTELRTAGKSSFAESGWLTVFQKFQQMSQGGCFSQPLGTSEDIARLVARQPEKRSASSVRRSAFHIIQAKTQDKLVFVAFPATNDPKETLLCVGIGSGLSVNSKTKYPVQAKKFLAFMVEPANVNAYATATSQVPAIPHSQFKASDVAQSYILKAVADEQDCAADQRDVAGTSVDRAGPAHRDAANARRRRDASGCCQSDGSGLELELTPCPRP